MAREFAATQGEANEMVRLAKKGMSALAIGMKTGFGADTVMNTVRRHMPSAFFRSARTLPAPAANDNVVSRIMPHNVSWSTDPVQEHAVSLPRLACLEAA